MAFQTNRLKDSFFKIFPEIKTSVVVAYWASSLCGSGVASPRLEVKTFSNPSFYNCDKTRSKIRAVRFTVLRWPWSINCEEQNESIHLLQTHSEPSQLTKAVVMRTITVLSRCYIPILCPRKLLCPAGCSHTLKKKKLGKKSLFYPNMILYLSYLILSHLWDYIRHEFPLACSLFLPHKPPPGQLSPFSC